MPITPQDYQDDAIKGAQLERLTTKIASEIVKKQDKLDVEIDVANKRLKLNNVSFTVTPAAD
jgi:hypothetical protein